MFLIRITQAFEKAKLPYALVGGYAVALHGAVRGTIDVDIIISLKLQDFEKAEDILTSIHLQPKLPIHASELFKHRKAYMDANNLIAWSFINPHNPMECVDIIITEDLIGKQIVRKQVGSHSIQVLSKNDLITMKKKASRVQDLEDIKALESL